MLIAQQSRDGAKKMNNQLGIIDDIPQSARYQFFCLKPNSDPREVLRKLAEIAVEKTLL